MSYRKKLIEVALPLEAINRESAREKSIRHGHPSTLHLWWARRPLATCRAVLWASLVDDPSSHPDQFPTEEAQAEERGRLFRILEDLVKWENSNDENVLRAAREEILKSTDGNPPPVLDPFCGGGSIPLEAQRLGLEAHGSDLNPVAVLITKALIEIPPKFADRPPVNRGDGGRGTGFGASWRGAAGLAADVRYYGKWMRDEAEKRIGHLYPKVQLPKEYGGGEATVIAWLWARTVKCPNPACSARAPLIGSFWLSSKKQNKAWIRPVVNPIDKTIRFEVQTDGQAPSGTMSRSGGRCLVCNSSITFEYIRSQGRIEQIGHQLMTVVAEGQRRRIYVSPSREQTDASVTCIDDQLVAHLGAPLSTHPQYMGPPRYGLTKHRDLFTSRQLLALTTFRDLLNDVHQRIVEDSKSSQRQVNDDVQAYAKAIVTYLAFALDKAANY